MKLDMQKIHSDSRFRTADSKSESDFNIELPRSFNVPDGVVAHIDDMVIPVSWSTIDERNNKGYVAFYIMNTMHDKVIMMVPRLHTNYSKSSPKQLWVLHTTTFLLFLRSAAHTTCWKTF